MQCLPENVFNSYWRYLLNEAAHYRPIMGWVLTVVSLILLIVFLYCVKDCVRLPAVLAFFILLISIYPLCFFRMRVNDRDFEIKLLVEVIAREPAVNGKEWRTITHKMNRYLFNEGKWNIPYYFYCEESCHRYFLSLIEESFQKQPAASNSSVTDAQANEGTDTLTFYPGPNYQKCLSKAAEIEQLSQKNYWRKQYPNIDIDALL